MFVGVVSFVVRLLSIILRLTKECGIFFVNIILSCLDVTSFLRGTSLQVNILSHCMRAACAPYIKKVVTSPLKKIVDNKQSFEVIQRRVAVTMTVTVTVTMTVTVTLTKHVKY